MLLLFLPHGTAVRKRNVQGDSMRHSCRECVTPNAGGGRGGSVCITWGGPSLSLAALSKRASVGSGETGGAGGKCCADFVRRWVVPYLSAVLYAAVL